MNKFNSYFKNSYGWDDLSKYLLIFGIVFSFRRATMFFGIILIAYGTWRSFSKNNYKRSGELAAFQNIIMKIRQRFYSYKGTVNKAIGYKIFACPNCGQKLRVPRKQGRITITCKSCSTKFAGKS